MMSFSRFHSTVESKVPATFFILQRRLTETFELAVTLFAGYRDSYGPIFPLIMEKWFFRSFFLSIINTFLLIVMSGNTAIVRSIGALGTCPHSESALIL